MLPSTTRTLYTLSGSAQYASARPRHDDEQLAM